MIKKLMVVVVMSLATACAASQKPAPQVASKSMFGDDCAKTCKARGSEPDCFSMCVKVYGAPSVAR